MVRLEGDHRALRRVLTVVPLEYEVRTAGGTVAVRLRAVVETQPGGEGFTRYETHDPVRDLWESSSTINAASRFERGHEVLIGRDGDGGLTMNVEMTVTRDLFF